MIDLKKKVGPLPVWAWAGAVGIGLVILIYNARRAQGSGTTQTATGTELPASGAGGVDPKTGLPFSLENIDPQTGLPGYLSNVPLPAATTTPSLTDETATWIGIIGQLRDTFAPTSPADTTPVPPQVITVNLQPQPATGTVDNVPAATTPPAAAPAAPGITHAQAIDYWRAAARAANAAGASAPTHGNALWVATANYVTAATHLRELGATPPAPDSRFHIAV